MIWGFCDKIFSCDKLQCLVLPNIYMGVVGLLWFGLVSDLHNRYPDSSIDPPFGTRVKVTVELYS